MMDISFAAVLPVDPDLAASIGAKAASDAAVAARYAFYSLCVQSFATLAGVAITSFGTIYVRRWAHNTNSLMKQLNELTAKNSRAEGVIEGRAEQKVEKGN